MTSDALSLFVFGVFILGLAVGLAIGIKSGERGDASHPLQSQR